ncbi:MAG: hypothetical protein NTZ65_00730 [Candidatus Berkelbacteria bacterium]|nr:hypothetical protein [Candidatus Berkelbacteria bacterium]
MFVHEEGDERGAYVDTSVNNEQLIGLQVDLADFGFFSFAGYITERTRREHGVYKHQSATGEVTEKVQGQWLNINTPNLREGLHLMAEIKAGRIRPAVSYERPQIESPAKEFREMLGDLGLVFRNWRDSRPTYIWLCAIRRYLVSWPQRAWIWFSAPFKEAAKQERAAKSKDRGRKKIRASFEKLIQKAPTMAAFPDWDVAHKLIMLGVEDVMMMVREEELWPTIDRAIAQVLAHENIPELTMWSSTGWTLDFHDGEFTRMFFTSDLLASTFQALIAWKTNHPKKEEPKAE